MMDIILGLAKVNKLVMLTLTTVFIASGIFDRQCGSPTELVPSLYCPKRKPTVLSVNKTKTYRN